MNDSLSSNFPYFSFSPDYITNNHINLNDSFDNVNDMPSDSNQNIPQDYNGIEGQNEEETKEKSDQKKNRVNGKLFPQIDESNSSSINKKCLSSENNTNSYLNKKRKKKKSKKKSNSNKNINGLNQSKNVENTKKGRLKKNSGKEGKHNKFSYDNLTKKSINSSLKIMINTLNIYFKKIKDLDEELKAKLNKYDRMFLNIKNEFTKENTKEMMKKNIGEIFVEKKIYKNYKNKDENYNEQSINLIYKISEKGNKEFKKFVNFFNSPYGNFWKRLNKFKNSEIDGNNDYLDEVVKMYNEYVENKFNQKGEEKYYYALTNLQINMCKIFDIK